MIIDARSSGRGRPERRLADRLGSGLATALGLMLAATAWGSPQSALHPAGAGAAQIAQLFWWMAAGAGVIWLLVMGMAIYGLRADPERHSRRFAMGIITIGGVGFPLLVLTGVLVYSLSLMPGLLAPGEGLVITVSGERWWWRVQYDAPGQAPVQSANEIRLPVGQRVEFRLLSPEVIHAFWIPALGGKIDMIPGRENRLVLEANRVGDFRGVCAEYCGAAHALMAFSVKVMEPAPFAQWLARQAAPARPPEGELAKQGQAAFLQQGCGACHRIAGTLAMGVIGPDLTHLGSRATLGAGTLPLSQDNLARWIAHPDLIKPGVLMPGYGMLDEATLGAISTYLVELH